MVKKSIVIVKNFLIGVLNGNAPFNGSMFPNNQAPQNGQRLRDQP